MELKKQSFFIQIYILCALAYIISILVACTNQDDLSKGTDIVEHDAFTELSEDLNDYYDNFRIIHPLRTRGDLGWGKFKRSVRADYLGHSNGGSLYSIGTSRKKWKELNKTSIAVDLGRRELNQISNQVDSLMSIYMEDKTNVGAIHNAVILQSYLINDIDFSSTQELVSSILNSMESLGINTDGINFREAVFGIDDFFDTIYDDDISVMCAHLITKFPDREDEINILKNYLSATEILSSIEDIELFTNGYVDIVKKSKISSDKKQIILSNITIAPASYKLWTFVDSIQK